MHKGTRNDYVCPLQFLPTLRLCDALHHHTVPTRDWNVLSLPLQIFSPTCRVSDHRL